MTLLMCLHGASVQSAFNFMEAIITDNSTTLNTEGLDDDQTVNYFLSSLNVRTHAIYIALKTLHMNQ